MGSLVQPRRVRLHLRLLGVAALLVVVAATAVLSGTGTHRRVDDALARADRAMARNADATALRTRFVESRRGADLLLAAIPFDLATLQSGPLAESYAVLQEVTLLWGDVHAASDGRLPAMEAYLDLEADQVEPIVAATSADDPAVVLLGEQIDAGYRTRLDQVDAYAAATAAEVGDALAEADRSSDDGTRSLLLVLSAGSIVGLLLAALLGRTAARQHHESVLEDAERHAAATVARQEQEIQNGLDMARTEEGALRVVERAVHAHVPGVRVEVLLSDSSRSHFTRPLTVGGQMAGGCDAGSPEECPALGRGHRLEFRDNGAVDACPHLPSPGSGAVRATCIPMSIAGSSAGVLHVAAPVDGGSFDLPVLETMARGAADRIGVLRAFARSEAQAASDPLTGLLNRRSLENRARRHLDGNARCTAAFGDLDHFKKLNDIHGHDTGDRALRLFARVLAEEVRPGDLVARYGGEEFVLLLVDCDAADALNVLHRVHERLTTEVAAAGVPAFTASFGVAEWDGDASLADLLARADVALLQAKREGRDCDRTYVRGQVVATA